LIFNKIAVVRMSGFETLEVDNILSAIKTWAECHLEIDAVALVGSWARKQVKINEKSDRYATS
jgi:hypothetical protein